MQSKSRKQQDGLVMGTQPCGRQLATLGYTHKYTQPHLSWGRTIPDQADQADQAFLISLALHALRWIRQDDGKGIR